MHLASSARSRRFPHGRSPSRLITARTAVSAPSVATLAWPAGLRMLAGVEFSADDWIFARPYCDRPWWASTVGSSRAFAWVLLCLALGSCRPQAPPDTRPKATMTRGRELAGLTLTCSGPAYSLLGVGDELTFSVARLRRDADGLWDCAPMPAQAIRWETTDSLVARVDTAGRVRGIAPGYAVIRASAGASLRTEREVRVLAPVSRIALVPREATVAVGDTVRILAVAIGEDGAVLERLLLLAITEEEQRVAEIVGWDRVAGTLVRGRRPGVERLIARVAQRADTAAVTVIEPSEQR